MATEVAIQALADAEGQAAIRARRAAQEEWEARQAELRDTLDKLLSEHFAATAKAEKGCQQLADNLKAVSGTASKACSVIYELTQEPPPAPVTKSEVQRRFSHKLAIALSKVEPGRFGDMKWHLGPFPTDGDWREAEEKLLLPKLNHLIERGTPNGSTGKKD